MPSVDPSVADRSSIYPTSPPGPPPPGRAVDSPDRRGPSSHGQYGYLPGGYGGAPGGVPPPSAYYSMGLSSNGEKPGIPFYGQYPPPQHNHLQPYTGYGNAPPSGYMPYAYGSSSWMPYEGSGGSTPVPGYFPSQRILPNDKVPTLTRSVHEGHATSETDNVTTQTPYAIHNMTSRQAAEDGGKDTISMSSSIPDSQRQQQLQNLRQNLTGEELERMKAAAVVELRLSEVKPIQTDFHFFVHDNKEKLQALAIKEVDKKLAGKSTEFKQKHRTFLIHSNLNCRILRAWEDLPRPEREEYFRKEEDDRHRFMEDDEVVSRHCFTLTARIRNPKTDKSSTHPDGESGGDDDECNDTHERDGGKCNDTNERDGDDSEQTSDIQEGKRLPDDATTKEESPSKKNKADDANDNNENEGGK
jgi:hypothetical protein